MSHNSAPLDNVGMTRRSLQFLIWTILPILIFGVLVIGKFSYRDRFIDVNSGRMKAVRYIAGFEAGEEISEPPFASLWKEQYGEYGPADWEQESKIAFFSKRSPHFGFHGAFFWQHVIVTALQTCEFAPEVRKAILDNFLKLLSRRDPVAAQNYAVLVLKLATGEHAPRIEKTNAPAWLLALD